ncbi:FAD-dependent oxidoreductase, partial [Pseudomonas brassicacearum]|uniref:FAD-dependent oxidoreductase n=1 Tax=Pseudomonas brassicacearum TaxID=930166 RepID=UPI000F4784B4
HTSSGYSPLLADCPQDDQHLRHNGCHYAYGTEQGFAGAQAAIELRRSLGIAQQVLSSAEVKQLEPALAGKTVAGILFPESSHMDDPRAFIEALAA